MDKKLLTILLVLKEHSNETNFLTQKEIINFINVDEYGGHKYDRKSIGSAINLIIYDEDIDKKGVLSDKLEELFFIRIIRGKCFKNGRVCKGVALINLKK